MWGALPERRYLRERERERERECVCVCVEFSNWRTDASLGQKEVGAPQVILISIFFHAIIFKKCCQGAVDKKTSFLYLNHSLRIVVHH